MRRHTRWNDDAGVAARAGVHQAPKVNSVDGDWRYNAARACIEWSIDLVDDSNRTGSMEAVVESGSLDSFFPVTVAFTAQQSICDISVPQCMNVRTETPERFGFSKALVTNKFEVVY